MQTLESKKIEDYLHLYLGCEVERFGRSGKAYGKDDLTGDVIHEIYADIYPYYIKLLLRPLSDITDEEAWTCLEYCDAGGRNTPKCALTSPVCTLTDPTFNSNLSPDQWFLATKYLLSKHFDLFGLIPAGLAIDKTTP